MNSPPPIDLYAYSPPESLWKLVETHVPPSEQDEIKLFLGPSLVEQSLELHEEVEMYLDIWRDYRDETEHLACNKLPEPPQQRELLVQQIKMCVEGIQHKANELGHDPDRLLSMHNTSVIDYVMGNKRPGSESRPSTACSDGRETPMRHNTPGSDGMSYGSSISEEVESMTDKLNYLKFDEVCLHLRQTLEDEVQMLMGDLKFLQGCLEEEADYRCESKNSDAPSIADLREERNKLEAEYDSPLSFMPDVLPRKSFSPPTKPLEPLSRSKPQQLQQLQSLPTRGAPLKASHAINPAQTSSRDSASPDGAAASDRAARNVPRGGVPRPQGPQHITLRTGRPQSPRVVRVVNTDPAASPAHRLQPSPPASSRPVQPSPPAGNKPVRPGSADRFRRMVISSRAGDNS